MQKSSIFLCLLIVLSASMTQSIDIFHEIARCHYRTVKTWRNGKPNVLVRDEQGQSILHAAVITGDLYMVQIVLASGVDVNLLNDAGQTALDLAVDYGDKDIVMALVHKKSMVTTIENQKYMQSMFQSQSNTFFRNFFIGLGIVIAAVVLLSFPIHALSMIFLMGYGVPIVTLSTVSVVGCYGIGYTSFAPYRSYSCYANSRRCYMLEPVYYF